jgi:hypothetical protein
MSSESWLKVGLPAFPAAFTILGAWLYWGDNPLPLLPPSIAFWGVVVVYYVFTHLYIPDRKYPLFLTIFTTSLWLVASIAAHSLGRFVTSDRYRGLFSVLSDIDFWYAYVCALTGCFVALQNFYRYEPLILAQIRRDQANARSEV